MIQTSLTPTLDVSSAISQAWLHKARLACRRIPPLWPLKNFVAVNPFLGLTGRSYVDVCQLMKRVTHESMQMSPAWFRSQWKDQHIRKEDLQESLRLAAETYPVEFRDRLNLWSAEDLVQGLEGPLPAVANAVTPGPVMLISDIGDQLRGTLWTNQVTEEVSKHCAAYFDEGQAVWRMPWRHLPLFAAWKKSAEIDAMPELLGLTHFRQWVKKLPEDGKEALMWILPQLGAVEVGTEDYLHRLLLTIAGWSGHVQYRVRQKAMQGQHDETLLDLLAVRLVYELALFKQHEGPELREFWLASPLEEEGQMIGDILLLSVWHLAAEVAFQRQCLAGLLKRPVTSSTNDPERPLLQAVFCIDVRSEVMRRSLESLSPQIQTLGFAGFFGMPVEHIPFGRRHGPAQCPVLLNPKYRVHEQLHGHSVSEEQAALRRRQLGRRVQHSWNAFKNSAVSSFSYVETTGLLFGWKLVKDAFASSPKRLPSSDLRPHVHGPRAHRSACGHEMSPDVGIPHEDQVQLALGALRGMGLTKGLARLILLCGHGSSTRNNPYGSSLDCGACGGHAGDVNARIAAAILNQPDVRDALRSDHGVDIPTDTWFLAGLHDTTTDQVRLFEVDEAPASHTADLAELSLWLEEAGAMTRRKRAPRLGIGEQETARLDECVIQRGSDWSEVRPEWGLAGNAAFIAAPRQRTRHLDLGGRVFLHDYQAVSDEGFKTLELILTAPMIVASWINLQYYASTVNNRLWGSGNKVTHNVVSTLGVCQGNGGDLRVGLPFQSVHDGQRPVHEPLKLSVFIEAPRMAIADILSRHEAVRQLVDHGWLHLLAIEDEGATIFRCLPGACWQQVAETTEVNSLQAN